MLCPRQKECLVKGLERSIRKIRLGIITDPEEIEAIIAQALKCRRRNIISDYDEINTSSGQLLDLLP